MSADDRMVFAVLATGAEVVRYYRDGKWFIEWPVRLMIPCSSISAGEAVDLALREGVQIYHGLPGGRTFDRLTKEK